MFFLARIQYKEKHLQLFTLLSCSNTRQLSTVPLIVRNSVFFYIFTYIVNNVCRAIYSVMKMSKVRLRSGPHDTEWRQHRCTRTNPQCALNMSETSLASWTLLFLTCGSKRTFCDSPSRKCGLLCHKWQGGDHYEWKAYVLQFRAISRLL